MLKIIKQKPEYTFYHLTDGKNIIYVEPQKYGGVNISSVHKPSREVGTGYMLHQGIELTREVIQNCLHVVVPNWADNRMIKHTHKYETLEQYLNYERQFYPDLTIEDVTISDLIK